MQVGTGFQQVSGKAVTEYVRVHPLPYPGTLGSVLTSVARRFGVDGPIAVVPAIAGKQPDPGFFAQTPPVGAEFIEQHGTEHHVAILAPLPPWT